VFFQILLCVLFVYLWFETVVLFLPDKLQQIVSSWQFGPHWTAKRKGDR